MTALNASSLSYARTVLANPSMRASLRAAMPPAAVDAALAQANAAARQLTEAGYWGWDKLTYMAASGLADATLVTMTQQGACGGGGCNPSYANSQFWQAHTACSAEVYGTVLFQLVRYTAAQQRLAALLANPPQGWPGQMYFNDPQDAQGNSTTLPQRPAGVAPISDKATEWADWCLEVMRHVAVAHWASGVRWCESDRAPTVHGGRGIAGIAGTPGTLDNYRVWVGAQDYGLYGPGNTRPATAAEVGTVAAAVGKYPPTIDVSSDRAAIEDALYKPDRAYPEYGSYHPTGYFRPTCPRGSAPARWTFGTETGHTNPAPKEVRGVSEIGTSHLPEQNVFQAFRDPADGRILWLYSQPGLVPQVTGKFSSNPMNYRQTWLQFAECLATRHGSDSGEHAFVLPEQKSDFDPVVMPSIIDHSQQGFYWADDLAPPASGSPRDILVALMQQNVVPSRGHFGDDVLTPLRVNWQLHWSSAGSCWMPSSLRQIWWCMAQAYDVVDTRFGDCVAQAFQNMLTGLNQIPPEYRVLNQSEAMGQAGAGAAAMNNLTLEIMSDAISLVAAGISIAGGLVCSGGVTCIAGAVLEIVAGLVALAAQMVRLAHDLGLARGGDPPVMPTVMVRVAGQELPTDACWLVQPRQAAAGGAAALAPKAQAVSQAARAGDPAQWYAAVSAAIAAGTIPNPPTPATVNKGVAFGAGAIAGLAILKLFGL